MGKVYDQNKMIRKKDKKVMGIGRMIGWCIFLFIGCSQQNKSNSKLEEALQLSRENRHELERVLHHFSEDSADSLKLKAAIFLIENMPGHWQPDSCCTRNFMTRLDSLKHLPDLTRKVLLTYPAEHPELCPDLIPIEDVKNLKADFLIRHIQSIFILKDSCPWLVHIDFDTFCEYLLPYRIGNEILEMSSSPVPDSNFYQAIEYAKNYYDDCQHSIQSLTLYLEKLRFPSLMPKEDTLLYNLFLTDINTTKETLIRYRAAGIPAVTDFSPLNRHQDRITYWLCPQDPRILSRNTAIAHELRTGKIYRQTFSQNPLPVTDEYIPPFFRNPFYKDVTNLYLHTTNVQISIPAEVNEQYAYLTVWDNHFWQPIAFSPIKEGNCNFTTLGRNCIYLPVHYPDTMMHAFASPFILNNKGEIIPLQINKDTLQTIRIERLQPCSIQQNYVYEYLRNTRLECADNCNFINSDTIYTIKNLTYYQYDTIRPDSQIKKRYWRIVSKSGYAHLAELYFYDLSGKLLKGTHLGPDTKNIQHLTDHDPSSDMVIRKWMGYDFGRPVSISKIIFLNFNDGEIICPNHKYELCYWDNGQWQTAETETAINNYIEFNQIPSSTLYYIKDKTRHKNGCLFTWENGKIRFW